MTRGMLCEDNVVVKLEKLRLEWTALTIG